MHLKIRKEYTVTSWLESSRWKDRHLAWLHQCLEVSSRLQHLLHVFFLVLVFLLDTYSTSPQVMKKTFLLVGPIQGIVLHNHIKPEFKPVLQSSCSTKLRSHIPHSIALYILQGSKAVRQSHANPSAAGFPAGQKRNQPSKGFTPPGCIGQSFGVVSLHCLSPLLKHSLFTCVRSQRKNIY